MLAIAAVSRASPTARRALGGALLLAAALLPALYYGAGGGPRFEWFNGYNRVFRGILLASADPGARLAELGRARS